MLDPVTRLFDNYCEAALAVDALKRSGIAEEDISLMVNSESYPDAIDASPVQSGAGTGAGIGGVVGAGAGLLAGMGALAIPGVGPVVAAGWLAATAVGAAAGVAAGGIIGALVETGVPEHDARVYSEAVKRGSTLVTVRTAHRAEAEKILDAYSAVGLEEKRVQFSRGDVDWDEPEQMNRDKTPPPPPLLRL